MAATCGYTAAVVRHYDKDMVGADMKHIDEETAREVSQATLEVVRLDASRARLEGGGGTF